MNDVSNAPNSYTGNGHQIDVGSDYTTTNDGKTMLITFTNPKARLICPYVIAKSVDCRNFDTGKKVRLHKDKAWGTWSFPNGVGLSK